MGLIEVPCREHFTELGFLEVPFKVSSKWFSGECNINTYHLEELMGTMLRALYQRSKGRDLFDQYQALTKYSNLNVSKVIQCYRRYMDFSEGKSPSQELYLENLLEKMADPEFIGDTVGLINQEEFWNAQTAFDLVKEKIIDNL